MDNNQFPRLSQTESRDGSEMSSVTAVGNWPEVAGDPLRPVSRTAITTITTSTTHHTGPEDTFPDRNNLLGHRHIHLLNEITTLHTAINALNETIDYQHGEISALVSTIRDHREEFQRQEALVRARNRRHDILDSFATRGVLEEGEWEVVGPVRGDHYGDAVEDAMLYIRGYRRDVSTWGRLYTLAPEKVMELYRQDDEASISVLDKRATIFLSYLDGDGDEEGVRAIEGAYRRFIYWLEQGLGEQPEEDPNSPLTRAFQEFWEVCDECGYY